MCSCMRCVWEKEWSLQCSAFCCQETVPGLWPPSNYTAAPVYMEIFFQTVAAGTQGWVLSLDVLKYLGRGAWVLPLSFIFYLLSSIFCTRPSPPSLGNKVPTVVAVLWKTTDGFTQREEEKKRGNTRSSQYVNVNFPQEENLQCTAILSPVSGRWSSHHAPVSYAWLGMLSFCTPAANQDDAIPENCVILILLFVSCW